MAKSAIYPDPFRIGFLMIDDFALLSYSAAIEPLRASNLLAGRMLYDIRHIPASEASSTSSSGAIIKADTFVGERVDFDLVFVVAGGDPATFHNARCFQWLRHLSRRGVYLGGISGGPVVLANAGVMQGRRMTVHWEHAQGLSEASPSLMIERSLYVIDRDRMTCAGGIAPLDMMHALIADHHGPDFARKVSDWFMHTQIRPSGGPQRAGLAERYGTICQPVIVAIEVMENHIADPLTLSQIARRGAVSSRQMNRLFRDKLGQTTMDFYRDLRLEKAYKLLSRAPLSITEIALVTGFANSAHFSHSFRRKFSVKPSSIRP